MIELWIVFSGLSQVRKGLASAKSWSRKREIFLSCVNVHLRVKRSSEQVTLKCSTGLAVKSPPGTGIIRRSACNRSSVHVLLVCIRILQQGSQDQVIYSQFHLDHTSLWFQSQTASSGTPTDSQGSTWDQHCVLHKIQYTGSILNVAANPCFLLLTLVNESDVFVRLTGNRDI